MSALPPKADIGTQSRDVRFVPCVDGSELARRIFTSQTWSVQPCVRPVCAVHMTAGHNALRGSGPGQNRAFKDAVALMGCPDRRVDRRCITCCSPSQPSRHTDVRRDFLTPRARSVPCSGHPWPSWPTPCEQSCWRARSQQLWSVDAPAALLARADARCHGSWHTGSRRARRP